MDAKMNAGALGGVVPEKGREAKEKEKRGKGRSEGKRKRARSKGAAKKRKALANIGSGANVDEDSGSKAADKMAKTGAAPRAEGAGKKPAAKTASSAGATKKSVSKKQPLPQSISAMSFGPHLQSKLKQLSSKIHMNVSRDDALVSYSPNSILAVHHAHARSPPAAGPSRPPGTLPVRGAQDAAEEGGTRTGAARAASRPRHPVMTPPGAGNGMRRAEEDTDGIGGGKLRGATEASSGKPTMVLQELYKSQCKKADTFVDYMVGRPEAKAAGNGKQAAVASSPSSSSEEGGLELKLDPRRLSLFNSLLAEILYLTGHDVLDVRELLEKLGTRCRAQSAPPFTVLEIRPYLQKLEDEGRIFLEEEGGREVVYACGV